MALPPPAADPRFANIRQMPVMPRGGPPSNQQASQGVPQQIGSVPGRALTRMLSPDQVAERDQAQQMANQPGQAGADWQNDPSVLEIARHVRYRMYEMRNFRNMMGIGQRLIDCLRNYKGHYDPARLRDIKAFGGSEVFARIVPGKCRGATSLLRDIYLGAERPWDLQPTPEPEIPEVLEQASQGRVAAEIAQCRQQLQQIVAAQQQAAMMAQQQAMAGAAPPAGPGLPGGAPPSPPPGPPLPAAAPQPSPGAGWSGPLAPESPVGPPGQMPQMATEDQIEDRVAQLREAARKAAKKKAMKEAGQAAEELDDLLTEGRFYEAFAEFLIDLPIFPFACIKGPTVRMCSQVKWVNGKPERQQVPKMFWSRVSPFDLYWTPTAHNVHEAEFVERPRHAGRVNAAHEQDRRPRRGDDGGRSDGHKDQDGTHGGKSLGTSALSLQFSPPSNRAPHGQ